MIPARYEAVRFPGKLLKDLGGKAVVVRTYEAAKKTNLFDEVYVVTDSLEIKKASRSSWRECFDEFERARMRLRPHC